MGENATAGRRLGTRMLLALGLVCGVVVATTATPTSAGISYPDFDKEFEPDTIGPDSTSTLVFTIDNDGPSASPREELAFTDTLEPGMVVAGAPAITNTCDGTVTAAPGSSTITLADGKVGIGEVCTISVNVTAEAEDASDTGYDNLTGTLTSSTGSHGTATDTLDVLVDRPGFTKSFTPSVVEFGERSTLTFTIDNSDNASAASLLDFTDTLPAGMVIADPALAGTTCGDADLTAVPGTSVIVLDAGSPGIALAAGATCTVTVDVIGGAVGTLENVSDDLFALVVGTSKNAGKASAALEVTAIADPLVLTKEFVDDPAPPGGITTLEFTITNADRDYGVSDIAFSDDLAATLPGLEAVAPVFNDCGGMATSSFPAGLFEYAGGSLAPEATCTVAIDVEVPDDATLDAHPNTAGPASGTLEMVPPVAVGSNVAGDLLFVVPFPILTKEFTDDPVGAGGVATLEFVLTNPSTETTMSDIAFTDVFDEILRTSPSGPPADDFCGTGSTATFTPWSGGSPTNTPAMLTVSGIDLAKKGDSGDSCTFSITLDVIPGAPAGIYPNITSDTSATLDDEAGTPTVSGPPAGDDLTVVGAPRLTKEFTDDPAVPGGTAELEFTLFNADPDNDATSIAFTDPLSGALAGLEASSVDGNTCTGAIVDITTDPAIIAVTGGSLDALDTCVITLTLDVPLAVGGSFFNETTEVSATVAGVSAESAPASDTLVVTGLLLSKVFDPDTVIPGAETDITFTLENIGSEDATSISFSDSLAAILPGTPDITATVLPSSPCGGSITGTTSLSFSAGSVDAGDPPCTFDVTVLVPDEADEGTYINVTSAVSYFAPGLFGAPAATAPITIDKTLIAITKEFTDDPVVPGDEVTLEFNLENLSSTETVDSISFSDDLGAALTGLEATALTSNTCDGTATAPFPTGLFEYDGGSLGPLATCEIVLTLDVPDPPLPGRMFPNTTSDVAGEVGPLEVRGDAASDTLLIRSAELVKSFDGPTVAGGTAELTFTITNLDSSAGQVGLAFSDDLDAALSGLEAVPPFDPDPCGAGSMLDGTGFLTLTGGVLPPGGDCTFSVTVDVPEAATPGTYLNVTSELFASGVPLDDPATAELDVEPPPTFAKAFDPDSIFVTETSTLTFTIDNSASAVTATDLAFTDTLPAGLVVATPSGKTKTCTGGMVDAVEGGSTISYSGGEVAAGASCTVSVDVTATAAGALVNTSEDLTSSSGNSGTATDTITVTALPIPDFAKAFDPDTIPLGTDSTLTFTVDNSTAVGPATDLEFTDPLPAGMEVATPAVTSNTCGGTLTADAGTTTISLTGGTVAALSTCTIEVDVTATAPGALVNTSEDLTSSSGNSGPATDTITVTAEPFIPVDGERFADTRSPGGLTFDGLFEGDGRFGPGAEYEVDVAGRGAIPADADGVIVNVTVVGPSAAGFATVHPCEPTPPEASTINYTTGVDVANEVFAPLSGDGSLCTFTSAEIDLLLDVVGYVTDENSVKLMTPARFAESRVGPPTVDGLFEGFGPTAPMTTTKITIAGRGGVPASGVSAVIANVTAVDPSDDNFITVFPCLPLLPLASSLNYTAGVNRANELVAELDADGDICVYTESSIDFIVDVSGYVMDGSDLASVDPARFVDTRPGGVTIDGVNAGTGLLAPASTTVVDIAGRDGVPADAIAAIVNVAAVDPTAAGFFTVDSCGAPTESSLNYTAGVNGANELVVLLDGSGDLCIFSSASTHVIMDVVGYQMPPPP